MKKNIIEAFYKYKDYLLLFVLSLIPLLWYGNNSGNLIFSNDSGYPLNPFEVFKGRLFTWNSIWNFGYSQKDVSGSIPYYGLETIFTYLTGSVFNGQKVFVVFWFFIIMAAMYWSITKISTFRQKPYLALLAAIFFGFNHFQLFGWRVLWVSRFSTYIALPFFFLLLTKYFENKISLLKSSLLLGLIVFLFNGAGSPPLFGVVILEFMTIILYYHLKYLMVSWREALSVFKKSVLLIFVGGVVSFLLSFYWLFPYMRLLGTYKEAVYTAGGPTLMLAWTDVVSIGTSVLNLIRLHGTAYWGAGNLPDDYQNVYNHPLLIIASFIWPVLAFSSILTARKVTEKKYLFLLCFLTIIGLVFSAGSHEPFRTLYIFLLNNVPGFPIFRSPIYKFGGLLWFAASILMAFSLSSFLEFLKQKTSKVHFFAAFLVLLILTYNFPFFNGKFFDWSPSLTIMEKIPSYVFDFGKWIDKHGEQNSKTLLLPELNENWHTEAFKWGYWSAGPVTLYLTQKNTLDNNNMLLGTEQALVTELYRRLREKKTDWRSLAGFLGVKHLLLRKDYFYDLNWQPTTSPFLYDDLLTKNDLLRKIKNFGPWDYYEISPSDHFLPLFYVPNKITYSDVSPGLISTMVSESFASRQAFIQSGTFTQQNKSTMSVFTNSYLSEANCILCLYDKDEQAGPGEIPRVSFLPGSPLYFLITLKEKKILESAQNLPEQRIDADLGMANKRLAEINQMLSQKLRATDTTLLKENLLRYKFFINDAFSEAEKLSRIEKNNYLIKIKDYLSLQQKIFQSIENDNKTDAIDFENLTVYLNDLFGKLEEEIWASGGPTDKRFLFTLENDGQYRLLFKDQKYLPEKIYIDGHPAQNVNEIFLTSGVHNMEFIYPGTTNLIENQNASMSAQRSLEFGKDTVYAIKNYSDDKKFAVKFSYRIEEGISPSFYIAQDNDRPDQNGNLNRVVKIKLDNDDRWHDINYLLTPNPYSKRAELRFSLPRYGSKKTTINIKNMQVYEVAQPQVFFEQKINERILTVPEITFQRINPTRYIIHVKNSTDPYFLSFNARFDGGWKAYLTGIDDANLSAGESVSYFNGEVKELASQDRLFDKTFFSTLFTHALPEENHLTINGYANGWLINKKGDYDVIVEYRPQKILYLGIIVSSISLIGVMLLLIFRRHHK